jgi:hypothetical protein
MFHGPSLWWRLVPKLRLVDMLFRHSFFFVKFFFFFLEVISRLLSYGPLNLCIKWKDNWIPGTKPLHESDEKSAGTAASALLFGKSLELRTLLEDVRSIAGRSIALGLRSFACAETRLLQKLKKNAEKQIFFFPKILKTKLK